MKSSSQHIAIFCVLAVILSLVIAWLIVPPLFNMNGLRPYFAQTIMNQTGTPIKINGKIHISTIGRISVVAHDITTQNGTIESVSFSIPMSKIFDIRNAPVSGDIYVRGANMEIENLTPIRINQKINISDSVINFMGMNYHILNGTLENGSFSGGVRTDQHKYVVNSNGSEFFVINKNEGLSINGTFLSNGGVHATLKIDTDDVNTWFNFFEPDIWEHVNMSMNIDWDGKYGFVFSDITGNVGGDDFNGRIVLPENGIREMSFSSDSIDFDLNFLRTQKLFLKNASLDLDLNGNLRFNNKFFNYVRLHAVGDDKTEKIKSLEFGGAKISGKISGEILSNGDENLNLEFSRAGADVYCKLRKTKNLWACDEYKYKDKEISAVGTLVVDSEKFSGTMTSENDMPRDFNFVKFTEFTKTDGEIIFRFRNMGGIAKIQKNKVSITYNFVNDTNLNWLYPNKFPFLPNQMTDELGDIVIGGDDISFLPKSKKWELTTSGNYFYLTGDSVISFIKNFAPGADLSFLNDFSFEMSGNFNKTSISDLELRIANHIFRGRVSDNNLTLITETLDMDIFANKNYFTKYDENQFLHNAPILIPFDFTNIKISLSAGSVMFSGEKYENFIWTLANNQMNFSISDTTRGSVLATIIKNKFNYDISVRLNRFAFTRKLLPETMPLNITESVATGDAKISSNGRIAYDFWNNMSGPVNLTFDGGKLIGIGTDYLYANALNLTPVNTDDILTTALSGGTTIIKSMNFSGEYKGGKFITTSPLKIIARFATITGDLEIDDNKMTANLKVLFNGISPSPSSIPMSIFSDGTRDYSFDNILVNFSSDYLIKFMNKS
ncbi:MAG: AsmA family protein [Rickettsiales bacterium]|nr:AsmA family protein [Rickettsiales bacterium]